MSKKQDFVPCLLEGVFLKAGYALVHDGQHLLGKESGKVLFALPPEEVRFFTHRLEWVVDNEIVGKAWFKYELRSWLCIDFDFRELGKDGKWRKQGIWRILGMATEREKAEVKSG